MHFCVCHVLLIRTDTSLPSIGTSVKPNKRKTDEQIKRHLQQKVTTVPVAITFPGDSLPVHSEDLHHGNADHECHDSSNSLNSNMSGSDEDEDNDSGSFLPLHAVLEAEDMALEDGEVLDELFSPSGVSPVSFTLYFQHSLIFIS